GAVKPAHFDDLRFYALVETMRLGTPPLRLGTYYLDQGRLTPEDVTVALLETTVQRVVDGTRKMIELERRLREPVKRTGPLCRWCPLRDGCEDGKNWIQRRADDHAAEHADEDAGDASHW
ncbi:MAG TPA: hypothetical protein VGQ20_16425, partial [Acidimicrobiales bacterium]|nr:hypothetical protein [Acidimicrobiales bacterium]